MTEDESDWLTRKEACAFLGRLGCPVSPRTMGNWASNGNARRGPPFTRARWRIVRYQRGDLREWAKRETVRVE